MSTRSVIARTTPAGFTGVYHHWDGYPSGVGATLYALYNGHFQKDIKAMMHFLIEDHPAGWSTINGADFSLEPGFIERSFEFPEGAPQRPQCYCHGDRHEEVNGHITMQGDTWSTEYAYAIDEQTQRMHCYKWLYEAKQWHCFAIVDLNGPAIDFERFD